MSGYITRSSDIIDFDRFRAEVDLDPTIKVNFR